MDGLPQNPAPRQQLERIARLLRKTIADGDNSCIFDELLLDGTKDLLWKQGYLHEPYLMPNQGRVPQSTLIELIPGDYRRKQMRLRADRSKEAAAHDSSSE